MTRHRSTIIAALGAVSFAWSGTAAAVPLSSRPTGPGAHYFGYFAGNNVAVGSLNRSCADNHPGDCVTLLNNLATHTNVVFIAGLNPWIKDRLAAAAASGMGAIIYVQSQFFQDGTDPMVSFSTDVWNQHWSDLDAMIGANIGSVVAFDIAEEPPLTSQANANANMAAIGSAAQYLKARHPNIPILVDFAATGLDRYGYSPLNTGGFTISPYVDWAAYNCYSGTPTDTFQHCYLQGMGNSVPYYIGRLKTIFNASGGMAGRGIVLIPEGYMQDTSASSQAALLTRVEREAALADNDPSIVMIMPFLWDTGGATDIGNDFGVDALPSVQAYYQAWGLHATTVGAQRRAYPTSTSATYAPGGAYFAFDYSNDSVWNSGVFASATPAPSISGSFVDPIRLVGMNLVVDQTPAGFAQHVITGTDPNGNTSILGTLAGNYSDGIVLGAPFSGPPVVTRVAVSTSTSPSWVAWRDLQPWTSGSTRVYGYPVAATASISAPENISDADTSTIWSSGQFASPTSPVSIDLDLGQAQTLSRIQLVVAQTPNGQTIHTVYAGPSLSQLSSLATIAHLTSDGDTLSLTGPFNNVRFVRIRTTSSPSWVAWREVNLFQ